MTRTQLSTTALHLHLCSTLASTSTGRTGFVTDRFLSLIDEDIALAVVELRIAGMWIRDTCGYRIPPQALRIAIEALHDLQRTPSH